MWLVKLLAQVLNLAVFSLASAGYLHSVLPS